jgi:hypothetical protein
MEVSGRLLAPTIYPQRNSLYSRLGGPQRRSGRYREEKNILPLPRIEPRLPVCPARRLVAIPTELSQLRLEEILYWNNFYIQHLVCLDILIHSHTFIGYTCSWDTVRDQLFVQIAFISDPTSLIISVNISINLSAKL